MITVNFDDKSFMQDLTNIVDYSIGFLQGIESGKAVFLENLGKGIKEVLEHYIDSNARINPQMLHHVYEWYQTGSPNARLFDISYVVKNGGLTFNSKFSQSKSVQQGSTEPFYNKAKIMEDGSPVTIKPRTSNVLVFENNGETVFTKSPITVENPGGDQVQGAYEEVFNSFFNQYFTQMFIDASGIKQYLENPIIYKEKLNDGKRGGRSVGKTVGYNWIMKAGVIQ